MAEIATAPHHKDSASSSTQSGSASIRYTDDDVIISYCDYNELYRDRKADEDDLDVLRDAGNFARDLRGRLESGYESGYGKKVRVHNINPVTQDFFLTPFIHIPIFPPNYAQSEHCMDQLVLITKLRPTIIPIFYYIQPSELRWTGKYHKGCYAEALRNYENSFLYDSQRIQGWRDALYRVANFSGFVVDKLHGGKEEEVLNKIVQKVSTDFDLRRYQVFINHRGDVKEEYAMPLYNRLISRGLRVFLDKPELKEGLRISDQIELAIQRSSVNIAMFSPRYAESEWCLDELFQMTKSTAPIVPVFYKVSRSDLQYTEEYSDGIYAKELRNPKKKQRYGLETLQRWREALSKVAGLPGFELDENHVDEILDNIVDSVLEKFSEVAPSPEDALSPEVQRLVTSVIMDDVPNRPKAVRRVQREQYYFGLAENLKEFEKTVLSGKNEYRPQVVGIVGDEGVGKTTLATEFFKQNRSYYRKSSFLFDVREIAAAWSLEYLEKKVSKDLDLGVDRALNRKVFNGQNIDERMSSKSCRVLVILDDVDHVDQLDAFMPIVHSYHPESLILVTSRDKSVLMKRSGKVVSSIYHLAALNSVHYQELFCSYAFNQQYPPPEFADLVDKFLTVCGGWPLSLKVCGALLCGEDDSDEWQKKLKQLPGILPREIHGRLRISYDSLRPEDKQIFLDIACFYIGEDIDTAIRIWGLEGLQNLENSCLLDVDSENAIRMQNHIRDLGKYIAQETGQPLRLWRPIPDIDALFEQPSKVIPEVRGIATVPCLKFPDDVFDTEMSSEISWSTQSDKVSRHCLKHLQLVATEGYYLERILTRVESPKLLWLRWHNCPYSSLPPWIPMDNVRVLQVHGSKLERLWQKETQAPRELRELNIHAPLVEFPGSLRLLQSLEKIVVDNLVDVKVPLAALSEKFCELVSLKFLKLRRCYKLQILPDSFGDLSNLEHIDLYGCENLNDLPVSFTKLTNLRHVDLSDCISLKTLPDSVGNLTNLRHIDLSGCISLKTLPDSVGNLTNLRHIALSGCSSLETVPDFFWNLTSIQHIDLCDCQSLKMLPDSLGNLINLQYIDLSRCKRLGMLPDIFENLQNLQYIDLSSCGSLKMLPKSLGNLTNLKHVDLCNCTSLKMLPESLENLTKLKRIDLSGCRSLEKLPDSLVNLTNLQYIRLSDCERLLKLPKSLGYLTNLQDIHLSNCVSLEKLPHSLGDLKNLQHIDLSDCQSLKVLPNSVGNLTNLQHINLSGCEKLEKLPDSLENLTNLQHIDLSGCKGLDILPESLGNFTNLKYIDLSRCARPGMLLDALGNLTTMQHISLSGCETLEILPESLGNLTNLQHIALSGLARLEKLPDSLWNLTNLQHIALSGLARLEKLPHFLGNLTNLQHIDLSHCRSLSGCEKLKMLCDSLANLTNLKHINLSHCGSLQSLPESLGNLTNLQNIDLSGCKELKMLCDSWVDLTNLKHIYLSNCRSLQRLPELLGNLTNLQHIDLSHCRSLRMLPDSWGNLANLQDIDLSNCVSLEILPDSLGDLKNLQHIDLSGCEKLEKLPESLGNLTNLQHIVLSRCTMLEVLPDSLGNLKNLERIDLSGCGRLDVLPDSLGRLTNLQYIDVSHCTSLRMISLTD